ncbi:MAG: LPS assembly protein LptD [Desulfohalobiaceae bacterium]|nr:LPS assembly protein LptD [Desulfohalobiaceae bacterium]
MKRKAFLEVFLLAMLGICAMVKTPGAQELSLPDSMQELPWDLKAESLEVDREDKVVHARGRVLLTQRGDALQADYMRYNWESRWVYLRGNVQMNWGGDELYAEEAEFDLVNKVGWLKQGRVFFEETHVYVKGERMKKTGPKTYEFEEATVTSCDGESPDWSLKTPRGRVTVDGYARIWHPRFHIKDLPLLYSPYLTFSTKSDRSSGFLIPDVGYSSEHGAEVNLPYYQVLGEEQDMTLYLNSMSRRGVMLGAEYRTTPNPLSKGFFRADWLQDDLVAESEAGEPGQFADDGLIRPNDDRYWVRSKYNGFLFSPEWLTKLDIDYVSDQNYLREFDKGSSGYDESLETFLGEFGRDIDDQDDLTRTSVWTVNRNWGYYGLGSRLEYTQNLAYMNDNRDPDENPTLQRLPEVTFDAYKQHLGRTPLEWKAENELTYFWREKGVTGTRLDLYPGLSLPLNSIYGSIIPSVNWRQTLYLVDQIEDDPSVTDNELDRGMWDFSISAFSSVSKIFQLNGEMEMRPTEATLGYSKWTKIKNTIQPRLRYQYLPEENQADLPIFDSVDDIDPVNELTYSLTSFLTARKETVVNKAQANGTEYESVVRFFDFCRFDLEQSYDFNEADRADRLQAYPDKRPFSDVRARLSFRFDPWLTYESTTRFSPYESMLTEHENMLRLRSGNRYQAYLGYDYQAEMDDINHPEQQELSIFRLGGRLSLGPAWTAYLNYETDTVNSELIEREIGLEYQDQCWGVGISHFKSEEETRVSLQINLLNLGRFQQGIPLTDS